MIDHVLGRPSVAFRKTQVFAVVCFWSVYLLRGNRDGPPLIRLLSERLRNRITPWQTLVMTMLWLYISRNFAKICSLESPEPLANLYSRSYFRATWITTALDAGFWTAMKIKNKPVRDIASVVFSIYYLFAAEQADEKVRRVRATLTVDHMRVSWNKSCSPYIATLTALLRPKFTRYPPRKLRIPRPPESSYREPVEAWLYFDGPLTALEKHTSLILDIPGGGFVAMDPRVHDDKLLCWAGRTGLPIISLDYRKAPEYPYPYALNECFDTYVTLVASKGRCIGMSGESIPDIVLAGDSAGGNLAVGTTLMIIQNSGSGFGRTRVRNLPIPKGVMLIYPALDMNFGSWMTDEQMALIQDRRTRGTNRNVIKRKSELYHKLDPTSPVPSDDELATHEARESLARKQRSKVDLVLSPPTSPELPEPQMAHLDHATSVSGTQAEVVASKPGIIRSRLALSSMLSYFNDRIITPEMMRAMIILYLGPHNRPDFSTEYLLSPLLAPEALLAEFPKVCFCTGERDPLVDDTVIFAGRIRQAKYQAWVARRELGLERDSARFHEREHVEVALLSGVSHGFFQFVSVYPDGWKHVVRCARWMEDMLHTSPASGAPTPSRSPVARKRMGTPAHGGSGSGRHHVRRPTDSSGDEDQPLMMTPISGEGGVNGDYHVNGSGGRGSGRKGGKSGRGRRRPSTPGSGMRDTRSKSSVSLASEDDIIQRRILGLTSSLMREEDIDDLHGVFLGE